MKLLERIREYNKKGNEQLKETWIKHPLRTKIIVVIYTIVDIGFGMHLIDLGFKHSSMMATILGSITIIFVFIVLFECIKQYNLAFPKTN